MGNRLPPGLGRSGNSRECYAAIVRGGKHDDGSTTCEVAKGTIGLFSWGCELMVKKGFAARAASE